MRKTCTLVVAVLLAACVATPPANRPAPPATAPKPVATAPVATAPQTAATSPNATEPSVAELPGTFYTLPNGSAVNSFDGMFLATITANGKVVGIFLANMPIKVNDDGTLNIQLGGLHIGAMHINPNFNTLRTSPAGSVLSGEKMPTLDSDPVAGYKKALMKNPALRLRDFLLETGLKDALKKMEAGMPI